MHRSWLTKKKKSSCLHPTSAQACVLPLPIELTSVLACVLPLSRVGFSPCLRTTPAQSWLQSLSASYPCLELASVPACVLPLPRVGFSPCLRPTPAKSWLQSLPASYPCPELASLSTSHFPMAEVAWLPTRIPLSKSADSKLEPISSFTVF